VDTWLETRKVSFSETRGQDIYLKKDFFLNVNEPAILYEVIGPYGFNYDQCVTIFNNLESRSGSIFYSDVYILNNDRTHLIISRNEDHIEKYEIHENDSLFVARNFQLQLEYINAGNEKMDPDHRLGYFDLDKLTFPLELRTWQEGDWFIPLGMKGKKKLSDFMIDKKIPLNLKKRLMVLLSGGAIAWIAGYRSDDRFKIQDSTRKILKITYLELDD
jgi:tRNA(Ile)-lysidine synthase